MPGTYVKDEHDIAGCITGVVEKDKIITGEKIQEGDIVLGLPSSGLHTNGYSLARKLFFEMAGHKVDTKIEELGMTVGEALLQVHTNYSMPVLEMIDKGVDIRGIAHITGGGFTENIPRVLPANLDAEIKKDTWPVLPIFSCIPHTPPEQDAILAQQFEGPRQTSCLVPNRLAILYQAPAALWHARHGLGCWSLVNTMQS